MREGVNRVCERVSGGVRVLEGEKRVCEKVLIGYEEVF